jgi:hypothetical protein
MWVSSSHWFAVDVFGGIWRGACGRQKPTGIRHVVCTLGDDRYIITYDKTHESQRGHFVRIRAQIWHKSCRWMTDFDPSIQMNDWSAENRIRTGLGQIAMRGSAGSDHPSQEGSLNLVPRCLFRRLHKPLDTSTRFLEISFICKFCNFTRL